MARLDALLLLARGALQALVIASLGVAEARVLGVVHLDGGVVDAQLSAHLVSLQQRRLRVQRLEEK